jgi:hypothetical protein
MSGIVEPWPRIFVARILALEISINALAAVAPKVRVPRFPTSLFNDTLIAPLPSARVFVSISNFSLLVGTYVLLTRCAAKG